MSTLIQKMRDRQGALASRIEQLEIDLASLKTEYSDLDTAIRIANQYSGDEGVAPSGGSINRADREYRATRTLPESGYGHKKAAIVEFARNAIAEHGAMNSRRILERLESAGLGHLVGGADANSKMKNLSAILSRDSRFASDKDAGGWIYKDTAPTA